MQEFALRDPSELSAAFLQGAVTFALSVVFLALYRAHGKRHFGWWSLAWVVYGLRIMAIVTFLLTGSRIWLYWHQVATGWTALALLWAALVFSRQLVWKRRYLILVLFPVAWSFVAINQLDNFLLAAGPAVAFLAGATLWTGWVFLKYARQADSRYAYFLAASFLFWGLHHLDYPFLRARGAWNPWGYYIDILVVLAIGAGTLLLALEDVVRGIRALSAMSSDPRFASEGRDALRRILEKPLDLPGVKGTALVEETGGRFHMSARTGECSSWTEEQCKHACESAGVVMRGEGDQDNRFSISVPGYAFAAALPLPRDGSVSGALLMVGSARDPFAALDTEFLETLGKHVSAALENADLYRELEIRTSELEKLTRRMMKLHEDERARIGRELHDESAQVFSAVKLRMGLLRKKSDSEVAGELAQIIDMVDDGISGLRSVTRYLRPPLLDDLGLEPAMRALCSEFADSGLEVHCSLDAIPATLDDDQELALFRALQEALSNTARHSTGRSVKVTLAVDGDHVSLAVKDNGAPGSRGDGKGTGLAGMRERIEGIGGTVKAEFQPDGFLVEAKLPLQA